MHGFVVSPNQQAVFSGLLSLLNGRVSRCRRPGTLRDSRGLRLERALIDA